MSRPPQIAVIGAGRADDDFDGLALEVGRRLAEVGARVICGGEGGVMEAAARGAREVGGEVIGILPGEDLADANDHITHPVATGIGHGRNLAVVASADAVIAIGGEWGTLAEIAFARRLRRPVVGLRSWSISPPSEIDAADGIKVASDPAEAIRLALG